MDEGLRLKSREWRVDNPHAKVFLPQSVMTFFFVNKSFSFMVLL